MQAKAVQEVCEAERRKGSSDFRFLYELKGTTIKEKIETIATEIYGADGCDYSEEAERKIADYTRSVLNDSSSRLSLNGLPSVWGQAWVR